jgi:hypothetical protein
MQDGGSPLRCASVTGDDRTAHDANCSFMHERTCCRSGACYKCRTSSAVHRVGMAELAARLRCNTMYGMSRPCILAGPDGSEAGEGIFRAGWMSTCRSMTPCPSRQGEVSYQYDVDASKLSREMLLRAVGAAAKKEMIRHDKAQISLGRRRSSMMEERREKMVWRWR